MNLDYDHILSREGVRSLRLEFRSKWLRGIKSPPKLSLWLFCIS